MAKLNKNDFIEIDYTGKLKAENLIFDTTDAETAKKEGMYSDKAKYGSIIISLGNGYLVKGLDDQLIGKDIGKHTFDLAPEQAFGKKDAKLVQMIPGRKFKEQGVNPMPGMQVNVDGLTGVIKTASGGRILVDFNHPLSGKDIIYEVNVKRIVTDPKEKVQSCLEVQYNITDAEVTAEQNKAKIKLKKDLPPQVMDAVAVKLKEITGVDIEFTKNEVKKPTPKPAEAKKV